MSSLEQARSHYEAGRYAEARAAAQEGLAGAADDAELLRIAGRAGVELGAEDAVDQLKKVAERRPDEVESWRDLGDALAAEGRMEESAEAFRKVLELDPQDETALTALGHAAYAGGSGQDAVTFLEQAAERSSGASSAMISLVDMYREMGQPEEALAHAQKISEAAPGDTLALLDVAELSLEVGRHEEAERAFERLRQVDELPDHDAYALRGMILAALRRDDRGRALELAREAAAEDLIAFLEEGEDAPSAEEVEARLSGSLTEHRRLHAEDRRIEEEDYVG
jgi:tetratricopeptide (TPR) repeat protein